MGYSIYVKTDKETKEKFYNFLSKNIKPINDEFYGDDDNYRLNTDLSYTDGSNHIIGFDYSCGGIDRTYIHTIVKWMASKLGKNYFYWNYKKIDFKSIKVSEQIDEIKKNKKTKRNAISSILGYKVLYDNNVDDVVEFIDNEIDRLDKLWDEI